MPVGPHRGVLGLLRRPLGQRHLAGRLLSRFRGLREPLRLALQVKKAVALSSLLKPRQHAGQSPHKQASPPSIGSTAISVQLRSKTIKAAISLGPLRKFLI